MTCSKTRHSSLSVGDAPAGRGLKIGSTSMLGSPITPRISAKNLCGSSPGRRRTSSSAEASAGMTLVCGPPRSTVSEMVFRSQIVPFGIFCQAFAEGRVTQRFLQPAEALDLARKADTRLFAQLALGQGQHFERRFVKHHARHRSRQAVGRGVARRHRAVSGDAARRQAEPKRHFLGYVHAPQEQLSAFDDVGAAFVDQVFGAGEQLALVLDHPIGSERAYLLVGHRQKNDVTGEWCPFAFERDHGHGLGHSLALGVLRASAIEYAVANFARERRHAPLLGFGGYHIGVGEHDDGTLAAVTSQPRVGVGAPRRNFEDLAFDAFPAEQFAEEFRGRLLVAGRIAGVDAQELLKQLDGASFVLREIDLRDRLRRGRHRWQHREEQNRSARERFAGPAQLGIPQARAHGAQTAGVFVLRGGLKNGRVTVVAVTLWRTASTVNSICSLEPGWAYSLPMLARAIIFLSVGDHVVEVALPTCLLLL